MTISSPRLVTVTMPAKRADALSAFYDKVLNLNFGRTINDPAKGVANSAFQTWVSAGVKWNISNRYSPDETCMPHFAVPSLATYAKKITDAGGTSKCPPTELEYHQEFIPHYKTKFEQFKLGSSDDVTPTLGRFQLFEDPDGNDFGIIEFSPWAEKLFSNGEISKMEIAEQRASLEHAREYEQKGYHKAAT